VLVIQNIIVIAYNDLICKKVFLVKFDSSSVYTKLLQAIIITVLGSKYTVIKFRVITYLQVKSCVAKYKLHIRYEKLLAKILNKINLRNKSHHPFGVLTT